MVFDNSIYRIYLIVGEYVIVGLYVGEYVCKTDGSFVGLSVGK
jgi:hypothetical protein